MQKLYSKSDTVADCGWLMAMSESVQSATAALASGDLRKFEMETMRQSELLKCVLDNHRPAQGTIAGDGGAEDRSRDQHRLRAVLAHQVAVLGRAAQRSMATVNAIRALQASPDGTYAFLVGQRRP